MDDKIIVNLNNECTATGFYYKVTPKMWEFIEGVSEEELGEAMPPQSPGINDDEAVEYRDALITFAASRGLEGADLEIEILDMPTKWFDSGWA